MRVVKCEWPLFPFCSNISYFYRTWKHSTFPDNFTVFCLLSCDRSKYYITHEPCLLLRGVNQCSSEIQHLVVTVENLNSPMMLWHLTRSEQGKFNKTKCYLGIIMHLLQELLCQRGGLVEVWRLVAIMIECRGPFSSQLVDGGPEHNQRHVTLQNAYWTDSLSSNCVVQPETNRCELVPRFCTVLYIHMRGRFRFNKQYVQWVTPWHLKFTEKLKCCWVHKTLLEFQG